MRARTVRAVRCLGVLMALVCAASSARGDEAWLEVSTPSEGETVRAPSGLVELRGRVGSGAHRAYDVVLAVDQSQSTLLPTGVDLDHDGVLGALTRPDWGSKDVCGPPGRWVTPQPRCRPFRTWTTDFDDAVLHAERALARAIVTRLETQGARVGVVSFSGKSRVDAAIGSSDALEALAKLPIRHDETGSNLGAAVDKSVSLLERARRDEKRAGAILLITDGVPTAPISDEIAAKAASRSAERARDAEIPLYIFQIRSEEDVDTALLAEMAERGGGRRIYVDAPERLDFALPSPSFADVESVEIYNRTLDRPARATRLYPGGAFDAFVPLAKGENALEIRARLPGGSQLELRRLVYFEQPEKPHASDTARMQALLEELRRRTLEAEHQPRPVDPERRSLRVRPAKDGEGVKGEPVEPTDEGGVPAVP
jgi:alpha-D-ribose 1-methylphosphonate 5-triphosphate synthase subunit PhnG